MNRITYTFRPKNGGVTLECKYCGGSIRCTSTDGKNIGSDDVTRALSRHYSKFLACSIQKVHEQ